MEIRQVQSFVHVARFGSFSRAAETMGYSQSAITVQIRLLEEELGTKLFDRELESPLHIGTIESLCTAKFPRILSQFHTLYPKVNIQITLDSPEKLIRMMEHNELDLIYILDTPRWNKEWIKVMEAAEPIVFVASVNSEFALRKEMVLQDILGEPFFLTEKNANYRQALDQHLALENRTLDPVLEISDTEFIIKMVERNDGLSFLPYFAVEKYIRSGRIAMLDVTDIDISMYRQIFYHKNKYKTREMSEFIRLITESEHA